MNPRPRPMIKKGGETMGLNITALVASVPPDGRTAGLRASQIQEVIRCVLRELANEALADVDKLLARYRS